MAKSPGKKFEHNIEESCNKTGIFYDRKRDIYIPPELRGKMPLPKQKYDCLIFSEGWLFPLELKSNGQKSIAVFDEKIIKEYQIESLIDATNYKYVIPGFLFNFRNCDNYTVFLHINDFVEFRKKQERKSIPINYCKEKGIEINNHLKRTNYFYNIEKFVNEAKEKYCE